MPKIVLAAVFMAMALGSFASSCAPASAATYTPCLLTGTTAKVCRIGGGFVVQALSLSTTAQTANVKCYDSATGSVAGTPIVIVQALAGTNPVLYKDPGEAFFTGLTCKADAAATGTGIEIDFAIGVSGS